MEEQRIGVMYVNMVKRWAVDTWDRLFPNGLMRSTLFPVLIIGAVVLLPAIAWYLHIYGQFHVVKRQIGGEQTSTAVQSQPGGYDPLLLTRKDAPSDTPQFRSATLLPGLGMDVLQLTASIPGRGEIPLLLAPSVADVAETQGPRVGVNDNHGGLEVPWSGNMPGIVAPIGTSLATTWKNHPLNVLRDATERSGIAQGGQLAMQGVDESQVTNQAGIPTATAEFKGTDFGGHWPSHTTVDVTAQLGANAFDLTITAKNVGDEPEPMGIGWHPRIAISSAQRSAVELRLPAGEHLEYADKIKGIPSGRISLSGDTLSRFQQHPVPIGALALDETEVDLHAGSAEPGPTAEIRMPDAGYGLRLIAMSPTIRALRITSPTGASYISLGLQTNYDDPFGKQWTESANPGIKVLEPGETLVWKVRLEIFAIPKH